MLVATSILGRADEPRFAERLVERLAMTSADASKRLLRGRTDVGSDIAIDLPRGSYVEDGAVLIDDGTRIVVAVREAEDALVIRLSSSLSQEELVHHATLIGHAFGNQHVAVEVVDGAIRVPITTSRDIAAATVERLGLSDPTLSFESVAFGRSQPLKPGHSHYVEPDDHHDDRDTR